MAINQADRLLAVETPLGKDKLLLERFAGTEGISWPFKFDLELFSEDPSINFEDVIGKNTSVTVFLADGSERFFHGVIWSYSYLGDTTRYSKYRAVLVPWFRLLTRHRDSRIFQNLNVQEILEEVFSMLGFKDYEFSLQQTYEKREFCVQYNETDFDFVSRLLEEEGIFYFFRHEKNKHVMVMGDSPSAHVPCPKQKEAAYQTSEGGLLASDVVTSFGMAKEMRSGEYSVNDYNFETPVANLLAKVDSSIKQSRKEFGLYEYPGNFGVLDQGDKLAKIRMEAEEARYSSATGGSSCRAFASGCRFDLTGAPKVMNGSYLLTSVTHDAYEGSFFSGEGAEKSTEYKNSFTCIPYSVPFRPPCRTRKPVIPGAQTAIVTGPKGEEIYTDKHGRVKVKFHWDRKVKAEKGAGSQGSTYDPKAMDDEKSSCWIRVAQIWAGKGYGGMFVPRIGDEVVVEFLEGNPDRPLVTGRVYHGINVPPYTLPDEKTKSTIKTNTTPTGSQGFNELRFEDKKDQEQIFIRGERNLDIWLKNDMFETVGRDSHVSVKNDRLVTVEKNLQETVKGNLTETVEGNAEITIKGNEARKVSGTFSIICDKGFTEDYKADCSISSAQKITLHGKSVVVEADDNITLQVGGSHIVIARDGIKIKTPAALELEGGPNTTIKGAMVEVQGSATAKISGGMVEVSGSLVKIN